MQHRSCRIVWQLLPNQIRQMNNKRVGNKRAENGTSIARCTSGQVAAIFRQVLWVAS